MAYNTDQLDAFWSCYTMRVHLLRYVMPPPAIT
jgi:hypothetical protein